MHATQAADLVACLLLRCLVELLGSAVGQALVQGVRALFRSGPRAVRTVWRAVLAAAFPIERPLTVPAEELTWLPLGLALVSGLTGGRGVALPGPARSRCWGLLAARTRWR
jgi:hypothetical protein